MKTFALLIAAGAMFAAGLADAQAQSRHQQGGSAKHWSGGHGSNGGHRGNYSGHGGYRGHHYGHGGYGHSYYRPYYGAYYRSYPYYPYSSYYYNPFPLYGAPAYYGASYPYSAPVYVERPYVEVQPRSPYYAPPPPMAKADPRPQRERQPQQQAQVFERYTLSARELFEFDRSDLSLPQPKLDEIATALKQNPQIGHVTITGHTDRLGAEEYNQKLSERRAQTVKQYLVSKGVEPKRLEAVGRGESQPVVECKDKSQSALIKCLEPNRRVEVEQITIESRQRQAGRSGDRSR